MTVGWRWWHRDGPLGSLRATPRRQKYLPLTDTDMWRRTCSCLNVASFVALGLSLSRYLSLLMPARSLSFNQLKHADFFVCGRGEGSAFGGQPLDVSFWDGWGWGIGWSLNTTQRWPQTFSINQVTVQGITHSLVFGSGQYHDPLQPTLARSYLPIKTVESALGCMWECVKHTRAQSDSAGWHLTFIVGCVIMQSIKTWYWICKTLIGHRR